jgi:hypothetical protein
MSYLAGCVDDLSGVFLPLVLNDFAKSILDCGIITLYKVPIHEAHRERRFPCVVW